MQILGPGGGFMNHMRWLLWLTIDKPTFHHSVMFPQKDVYRNMHNDGWPDTLEEFNNLPYEDLPASAVLNPKSKVKFIKKYVYNKKRSKQNWLEYEWKFRNKLEMFCKVEHLASMLEQDIKTIVMCVDVEIANNHYKDMNKDSPSLTKKNLHENYIGCNINWLRIESKRLLYPVLDKELYNAATEYFDIDNNYKDATIVHKLWYDRIKN